MGNIKSVYSREAYTILSLLGDFGGFTDALVLIISLFTSFYSARMFNAAIAEELPYSTSNFLNKSPLQIEKLKAKAVGKQELQQADLDFLYKAIGVTKKRLKVSFLKTLCFTSLFCKRDKEIRAQ